MDRLAVVQFLHPGGEDAPGLGGVKPWNDTTRPHRRNFLVGDGATWADGVLHPEELGFWGEWEPEAVRIAARPNADPHDPHHFYRPYWVPRTTYSGLHTTDPFVFGDEFLYTVCQQQARHRLLKHLGRGSVILFGSRRGWRFTLDTVFVVWDWVDYDGTNFSARLSGRTSPTFEAVTLGPLGRQPQPRPPRLALPMSSAVAQADTLRLYFGATVTNPVAGMFSFFPCLPYGIAPDGFACPIVDLPGCAPDGGDVISHGQFRGVHGTDFPVLSDVRAVWDEVVSQVTGDGLRLGVQALLPPQRNAVSPVPSASPAARSGLPQSASCAALPPCARPRRR